MGTKRTRWIGALVLSACLLVACGEAERGTQEDLRAQLEGIDLPTRMVELDRAYMEAQPTMGSTYTVWYQVNGPLEEARAQLVDSLGLAGWDINESSASFSMFAAKRSEHIMFVVLGEAMISQNPYAPPGTGIEISATLLSNYTTG